MNELIDELTASGAQIEIVNYRDTISSLASAMFRCHGEALLPCEHSLGPSFPLPWIGHIPDLQHKRLPQFFSERECLGRDRMHSKILAEASVVIVNSAAVVRDIKEFHPHHKARLVALPFCPVPNLVQNFAASASQVRGTYGLPSRYFMVSNQFWIHKSHKTALLALLRLREDGHDVHLVCTGNTYDYRWPKYFNDLKDLIEKHGLRDYVRILGVVPKADQLAIMHESIAVIQPTLFEGRPGGGAVYDAISLGTPSIVSDIPVNREINMGNVLFFTAGSVENLAEKMATMLVNPPQRLSNEQTFAQLAARQQEIGRILLDVARMAGAYHPVERRPVSIA